MAKSAFGLPRRGRWSCAEVNEFTPMPGVNVGSRDCMKGGGSPAPAVPATGVIGRVGLVLSLIAAGIWALLGRRRDATQVE